MKEVTAKRAGAALLTAFALVLLAIDLERVVLRLRFDYDLLLWGDDYFMTSMAKLAAGLPVYTRVSDANSTVYSPGGPWLHHVLLAPFGASTSLLANRLVNLVWLAAAVSVGTLAVRTLARVRGTLPRSPSGRAVFGLLAFAVLGVTVLANPVTDSLHPTNLELIVLSVTLLVLARWTELSSGTTLASLIALPALALLAKQTAGVAVTAALSACVLVATPGPRFSRLLFALVPVGALGATFAGLVLVTHGLFATWGLAVLAQHPFDWWKVSDLYAGYFLLFLPSFVTVVVAASVLPRRRAAEDAALLRAGLLLLAYAPPALSALFKTMGGPNNLAVLGYLLVSLALPLFLGPLFSARAAEARSHAPRTRALGVVLPLLLGVQLLLLHPRRRVPDAHDFDNARIICGYAARRMQCGERVHLGRGAVCYARGGVAVPLDRLSSIVEVTVAGRASELGFRGRVVSEAYDVLIIPMNDLLWFGSEFWRELTAHYAPFFQTHGELDNDFWFDGWQGYVSWPMVFFERLEAGGTHRVDSGNIPGIETAPCGPPRSR